MQLFYIRAPDSNATYSCYVGDNCKISTLQSMIAEKLGIPQCHQKLYSCGKHLLDHHQLAFLPSGSNIDLLIHLKGVGSNCEIRCGPGEYRGVSSAPKIFFVKSVVIECTNILVAPAIISTK